MDQFEIEYTHHATAMEGNSLTYKDVKNLLLHQLTPNKKLLKDLYEVINHASAYEYLLAKANKFEPITEELIKKLHAILMDRFFFGGEYRKYNVYIQGASHVPPDHYLINNEIKQFLNVIKCFPKDEKIKKAAWLHGEFVRIHPFGDANHRIACLLMNYQLIIDGLRPIVIKWHDKRNYFAALDEFANNKNANEIVKIIEKLLSESNVSRDEIIIY